MAVRNEKETPRKTTREPEKRMSKTETLRTLEEAHKEMRRRVAGDSGTRKK